MRVTKTDAGSPAVSHYQVWNQFHFESQRATEWPARNVLVTEPQVIWLSVYTYKYTELSVLHRKNIYHE